MDKVIIVATNSRGHTVFKGEFFGDWIGDPEQILKAVKLILKSCRDLKEISMTHVLSSYSSADVPREEAA